MEDNEAIIADSLLPGASSAHLDEGKTGNKLHETSGSNPDNEKVQTLSGEMVEDEFVAATLNHNFLIEKIDALLDKLKLDA
jgi:hypothetical protein